MSKTVITLSMTQDDQELLALAEEGIRKGIQQVKTGFKVIGDGLAVIRKKRLYRQSHSSFDAYCRETWGFGENHANKMIRGTAVVENLGTIVPCLPERETQVRPLTGLPAEQQVAAWEKATAETINPTAKQVAAAVQEVAPNFKGTHRPPTAKQVRQAVDRHLGRTGPTTQTAVIEPDEDFYDEPGRTAEEMSAEPDRPCPHCKGTGRLPW